MAVPGDLTLTEDHVRAKVVELLDMMQPWRMDAWIMSAIGTGVADYGTVVRVLSEEVSFRSERVRQFWTVADCNCRGQHN